MIDIYKPYNLIKIDLGFELITLNRKEIVWKKLVYY